MYIILTVKIILSSFAYKNRMLLATFKIGTLSIEWNFKKCNVKDPTSILDVKGTWKQLINGRQHNVILCNMHQVLMFPKD